MKLTKLMKEAMELFEKGHKGWFSFTAEQIQCHMYLHYDNPDYVMTDKQCVTSNFEGQRCKIIYINSSTMKGLINRGLVTARTVDILSERFGMQTFDYYTVKSERKES